MTDFSKCPHPKMILEKIDDLIQSINKQDRLREITDQERHNTINNEMEKMLKQITENTRWRYILLGIYIGSSTIIGTAWTIFTFIIK